MRKQLLLSLFPALCLAQQPIISKSEVVRVETELASDAMEGRKIFTPGIERASAFIEKEFAAIGLAHFGDLKNYRQEFVKKARKPTTLLASCREDQNQMSM